MNNFIFGSGIVGLLAKVILGDNWQLVPFGRSRFYSFMPALGDNYIGWHTDIDEVIRSLGLGSTVLRFQRAISYGGELIFSDHSFVKRNYIAKLFGNYQHPAANTLLRTESMVYKEFAVTDLYGMLQKRFASEIRKSTGKFGRFSSINTDAHTFTTSTGDYGYDKIISTIPLDAMCEYAGLSMDLPSRDVWYYDVRTPSLDFEGARQVFVADMPFDFFKVTRVTQDGYVFECLRDLGNPTEYLGAFLKKQLEVENFTSVDKAIPLGAPPQTNVLESNNIYPVGCHAQWDYFMDVGSSTRRLLRLRNEGI